MNLINGSPTGTYSNSYIHGLGYPPVILAYNLISGTPFYSLIPYVELSFGAPDPINTYAYLTTDNTKVNLNVFGRNIAGAFTTTNFSIGVYIFNLPAVF